MNAPFPRISIEFVHRSELPGTYTDGTFAAYARERAGDDVWVFLRSGGGEHTARFSIAGWDALVVFEGKAAQGAITVPGAGTAVYEGVSLLGTFEALTPDAAEAEADGLPFHGGFMGYFAYDIKNEIERLPQTATDDLGLPDIFQIFPQSILIHDRKTGHATEIRMTGTVDCAGVAHREPPLWSALISRRTLDPVPQMQRREYLEAVQRIREYIRNGDVYQANLAQRFVFDAPAYPYAFWDELYARNPAPYYAYIRTPAHQVLCTSMERCAMRSGGMLRSQPIKGTRPRGATPDEDAGFIRELLADPKENAELSMIVDLVRNDLSRVCKPGTVRVAGHALLDSYANVHHLSSVIDGRLRDRVSVSELLRALLPAGSVTGCPKIRAMEIIDELEPVARHVYTGSIGYTGLGGTMDMNVAIRTAVCTGGQMFFSAGSGIVYDSDPVREYEETLHKGQTLFTLIRNLKQ